MNNLRKSWKQIFFGVSQGSIMGSILLNVFLNDLFHVTNDIDFASDDGDKTLACEDDNIKDVML